MKLKGKKREKGNGKKRTELKKEKNYSLFVQFYP